MATINVLSNLRTSSHFEKKMLVGPLAGLLRWICKKPLVSVASVALRQPNLNSWRLCGFACARIVVAAMLPCVLLTPPARADVSFTRDIAPILLKRCTGCHGEKTNLGGYRAHTFQYLMKPAASGAQPIVPGKPEQSSLYRLVSTQVASIRMPKSDDPLTPLEIGNIRAWIVSGAKFDGTDPAASIRNSLGPRVHPAAPSVYKIAMPVMALAVAPGGSQIAVGGYNEVTVWNSATGALVRRIGHLPQRIQSLAFNSAGTLLLVAGGTPGEYGEASLLDLRYTSKPYVLGTFADIALCAVFNSDGTEVAVGGADGNVSTYDVSTRSRKWVSSLHSDWVTSVSFSTSGKYVASASKDMTVKLHNVSDGTLYTTYAGHNRQIGTYKGQDPVYSVQFENDSDTAVSAGGGKWVQLWNPEKTKEEAGSAADMEERFAKQGHTRYIPHGFEGTVLATTISANHLFAASADGLVKEFDLVGLREVQHFAGHKEWVYTIAYDAATHRLFTGAYNGEIRVWNADTGKCLLSFIAKPV